MITIKKEGSRSNTVFDLAPKIASYNGDVDGILDFFSANSFLVSPSRVQSHVYHSNDAVVLFLSSFPYDRLSSQNRAWASSISDEILKLKPRSVGGKEVERSFGDLIPSALMADIVSFYKLTPEQQARLHDLPLVTGKIFKSHSWYHYFYALAQVFEVMDAAFKRFRGKKLIVLLAPYAALQYPTKVLNTPALRKFIDEEAQGPTTYFPSFERSGRKIDATHALDVQSTREALLAAWADHLERPRMLIEEAVKRMRLVGINRSDKNDLSDFISLLERLTPQMLDEISTDVATAKPTGVVAQVEGVDRFEIDAGGLHVVPKHPVAESSSAKLASTHRVAVAAFEKFEIYVGNLENTHYRAFVRFADTLRIAIGDAPESADVVMLACLERPFARLLAAAQRDEQRSKEFSEWEAIDETKRVQLEWLSKSISDLHKTLLNSAEFEQSRLEHGVQQSDVVDNRKALQELVETLHPLSREAADRLSEFIALSDEIGEGSSEIAHAVMASVHNLVAAMIQVVVSLQGKGGEVAPVHLPEQIPERVRPGWDAFRKRAGERLADLLFSRLGVPGVVAVSALFAWFQSAAPSLAASSPTLFSGLQKAIELWMPK